MRYLIDPTDFPQSLRTKWGTRSSKVTNKDSLQKNKLNPPIVPRDLVLQFVRGLEKGFNLYIKAKSKHNALFQMRS